MSFMILSVDEKTKKKLDLIVKDENMYPCNCTKPWNKSSMIQYLIDEYYKSAKKYIEKWCDDAL